MSFRWWYFYFRNGSISSSASHTSLLGCFKRDSTLERCTVKARGGHSWRILWAHLFVYARSEQKVAQRNASICGAGSLVVKGLLVGLIGNMRARAVQSSLQASWRICAGADCRPRCILLHLKLDVAHSCIFIFSILDSPQRLALSKPICVSKSGTNHGDSIEMNWFQSKMSPF